MALVIGTNCGFCLSAPSADPAETGQTVDSNLAVGKFTSPSDAATITEIGWYAANASEEANWEAALYAADGGVVPGEAGTRLQLAATNAKGTTEGWKACTGLSWTISGSTDYWLGIQLDNTATATAIDRNVAGGAGYDFIFAATAAPNPAGGGALTDADGLIAIYAVYTTSGGGSSIAVKSKYYAQMRNQ